MRVALHLVEKRRALLRDLIRRDGFLPLAEICRKLEISEATARRDLATVAGRGEITRTRGGALADYNTAFASHGEREGRARTAKARVADGALGYLKRGMCVFLDAGTTVQAVARRIHRNPEAQNLTVVTNSLPVATVLGGAPGVELHLLGGVFLHRQAALLGREAIDALLHWRFDLAFMGGEGFDERGISNSHEEIAAFQRAVLERAEQPLFCLDGTKAGRGTPHLVASWADPFTMVSDAPADVLKTYAGATWRKRCQQV